MKRPNPARPAFKETRRQRASFSKSPSLRPRPEMPPIGRQIPGKAGTNQQKREKRCVSLRRQGIADARQLIHKKVADAFDFILGGYGRLYTQHLAEFS
jgi:hypothetical protein